MPIVSYTDAAGEVRWGAKARNHKTTADGSEGYSRPFGAREGIIATLKAILETTNENLADGPMANVDLEQRIRLEVANYLDRQTGVLRAELAAELPGLLDAIDAGAKLVVVAADELERMADTLADQENVDVDLVELHHDDLHTSQKAVSGPDGTAGLGG